MRRDQEHSQNLQILCNQPHALQHHGVAEALRRVEYIERAGLS